MPKYYGCPCEGCGAPLSLRDDIVVCPDCGAPYHRTCYEKLGRCAHSAAHGAGYEWKFPYQDAELRTCPACGERTLRSKANCRCCGAVLPPENTAEPNDRAAAESERDGAFDYAEFYQQMRQASDLNRAYKAAFGPAEQLDGIPCKDWLDYIGAAGPAYLADYGRMQLQKSKISMSFSALLFGPLYFFYRKAWKPAFGFLAAEMLLMTPTFIDMLQISGSALAPNLSSAALLLLARVCSVLSFALMILRGMYGKWFYRKSAAERIRRIRQDFPDPEQRRAVLAAQGGTSWAAVLGAFMLMMLFVSVGVLLLGPDMDALLSLLYG